MLGVISTRRVAVVLGLRIRVVATAAIPMTTQVHFPNSWAALVP